MASVSPKYLLEEDEQDDRTERSGKAALRFVLISLLAGEAGGLMTFDQEMDHKRPAVLIRSGQA